MEVLCYRTYWRKDCSKAMDRGGVGRTNKYMRNPDRCTNTCKQRCLCLFNKQGKVVWHVVGMCGLVIHTNLQLSKKSMVVICSNNCYSLSFHCWFLTKANTHTLTRHNVTLNRYRSRSYLNLCVCVCALMITKRMCMLETVTVKCHYISRPSMKRPP